MGRASTRLGIVEAAYRLDLPEQEHLTELARSASQLLTAGSELAAFVVERGPGSQSHQINVMASTDDGLAESVRRAVQTIPASVHEGVAASAPCFTTCSQLLGRRQWRCLSPVTGLTEFACLLSPIGTATVTIGTRRPAALNAGAAERRHWAPVAAHISAAWRLRRVLEQTESVTFRPSGTPIDEGPLEQPLSAPLRARLRRAVLQRESSRARHDGELWPALIAGEWVLIDRFESSGRRVVVAHRTDALARPLQALTRRERLALHLALRGMANKVVALELGVSESTVSRLVERALRRLSLSSLAEAAELRSMSHCRMWLGVGGECAELAVLEAELTRRSLYGQVPLTRAERSVLSAVLAGQSHQQIAAARCTSRRTVDNQVASIFAKLGINSRRELVTRILFGASAPPVPPSVLAAPVPVRAGAQPH